MTDSPIGAHLLLCTPHYGEGTQNVQTLLDLWHSLSALGDPRWAIHHADLRSSLLTFNFNRGWAEGLALRDSLPPDMPLYFLLLHGDIRAKSTDWFPTLLGEMRAHQADVLSAIVPIKDARGLTSTARDTDPWRPVRYTMTEVLKKPLTWTVPDLLFNTGMLLVNFRSGDWVERVCFTINDLIRKDPVTGEWCADVEPEDWNFSRQCTVLGVRCYVTRAVALTHVGVASFDNDLAWGEAQDSGNLARLGAMTLAQRDSVTAGSA